MKKLATVFFILISVYASAQTDSVKIHVVKYQVIGIGGPFNVTINDKGGIVNQFSNVASGWEYSFDAKKGDFLSISAQNTASYGNVHVFILLDGKVFQDALSEGGGATAAAKSEIISD
jgi:hypothetical protein